ncbi:hypothetical protein TIFTF001_020687, partial [Ficus carica]
MLSELKNRNRIYSIPILRTQRLGRHRGTKTEAVRGQEERQSTEQQEITEQVRREQQV